MGFITLEDLTGQIEGLVFPKMFERYSGMMATDDLVVLQGKLSVREDEEPKFLVDKVTPLLDWKPAYDGGISRVRKPSMEIKPLPLPKKVYLSEAQIAKEAQTKLFLRCGREQMEEAKPLLALHPGAIPVYFHLPQEGITLLAPQVLWCNGKEKLLARLKEILTVDNVKLVTK